MTTPKQDLIERMGLAIEHAEGPATDIVCEAEARAAARVMLEAMRKPTQAMIDAAHNEEDGAGCTADIYRAMLDAFAKESGLE